MTTISMPFSRKAIIPVWLVVFGLFALFGPPVTFATGVLLLIVGVVAPVIMLTLWKEPAPAVAEVLHHVEAYEESDDAFGWLARHDVPEEDSHD